MLLKNYRFVILSHPVSTKYERIILKQVIEYIDKFLSSFSCGNRKGYLTQYAPKSLVEKWKCRLWRR